MSDQAFSAITLLCMLALTVSFVYFAFRDDACGALKAMAIIGIFYVLFFMYAVAQQLMQ